MAPVVFSLYLWQVGQRLLYFLLGIGIVCQLAREVSIIGSQVEVSVPAMRYQDGLGFPFLFTLQGFINSYLDVVAGLGAGNNTLGASKGYSSFEGLGLVLRPGLNQTQSMEVADDGCHAVVAQSAGVDWRRDKCMAQGVH